MSQAIQVEGQLTVHTRFDTGYMAIRGDLQIPSQAPVGRPTAKPLGAGGIGRIE